MKRNKISPWPILKKQLAQEKKKRKKIVFTNGCFDLIHSGHLKVFHACKKFGDVLVVGINSDQSVRRLKGPSRPLINQKDRAQLLSEFITIDYVTVFNEDTPLRLIQSIRPDVLVKGGDWKSNQIVGRDVVRRVVRVPLIKGVSTSQLIRKMSRFNAKKKH